MLSKNDYMILIKMFEYGCVNEMKSATLGRVKNMTPLSLSKIRKTIKVFKDLGYVKDGVLNRNAKTYYVSELGINKIKELMEG